MLCIALSQIGCSGSEIKSAPNWINHPGEGVVAFSTTHVKGRYFQEELAISRARERLAARLGVSVSSIQTIQERVTNARVYTTSEKIVGLHVEKQTVRAQLRGIWRDEKRDQVWVWLYPID